MLRDKSVAMWVRAQKGVFNRPIIVAVDEIGNLSHNEDSLRCVLSTISGFAKEIWEQSMHQQQVIGLVTALPKLDLSSLSSRQPFFVRPPALSTEESGDFLKRQCKNISAREVEEIVTMCGGHPRSLAVSACKYKANNSVPRPDEVAQECNWKTSQGRVAKTVAAAIGEAFTQGDDDLNGRCMMQLNDLAMLMIRKRHYAIPPTVLYCDPEDRTTLSDLHEMFACRTSDVPSKKLENTNFHFERFKARFHLPVLPPSFKKQANTTVASYSFDPSKPHATISLRQTSRSGARDKPVRIDPKTYYFPASQSHRAFESMCVATSDDGVTQVLCLFQSKINNELAAAIDGLNQAAKELAVRLWCDKPFLFIVFALDCLPNASLAASHHPIVLVHRQNLHEYFTATLAPVAELCWLRRQKRDSGTRHVK